MVRIASVAFGIAESLHRHVNIALPARTVFLDPPRELQAIVSSLEIRRVHELVRLACIACRARRRAHDSHRRLQQALSTRSAIYHVEWGMRAELGGRASAIPK